MRVEFGPGEFPAKSGCYKCGLSKSEPYVHTEVDIELEGDLVFCQSCVKEMGQLIGMLSNDTRIKYIQKAEELAARIAVLTPQADAYKLFARQVEENNIADFNENLERQYG